MVTYPSFHEVFREKQLIVVQYSLRLHQVVNDQNFTKKSYMDV